MSDRGAFLSFLDWLNRPSQAVLNGLQGRWESAGRQLGQFGTDLVDAALPGDWLPNDIARPEDETSASQALGIDKTEHPWLGFGADLVGGALTDPLTYIPGAAVAKGLAKGLEVAGSVGKGAVNAVAGAEAAGKAADAAAAFGRGARRTFAAEKLNPVAARLRQASTAAQNLEGGASAGAVETSALAKLSPAEGNIVGDVLDNQVWDGRNPTQLADPSLSALDRVAMHPDVTPENVDRITAAVRDVTEIGQNQAKLPGVFWKDPSTENPVSLTDEYLAKRYGGQTSEQKINEALGEGPGRMGEPGPMKARTLQTPEDIGSYLGDEPGVSYERNAVKRMAGRAQMQGTLAKRATIGKGLVDAARAGEIELPEAMAAKIDSAARDGASQGLDEGLLHGPLTEEDITKATDQVLPKDFALADEGDRKTVNDLIRKMAESDPESAKAMFDDFNGMKPRGTIMNILAKSLKPFKQFAVYGALIPRFGADVRNAIGDIWKAASSPEARSVAPAMAKRLDGTIVGSISDAFGMKYPRDQFQGVIKAIDEAMGQSGGSGQNAIDYLTMKGQHDAVDVLKSGVLNGFMRADDMVSAMSASPLRQKLRSIMDIPGNIYRGIDDRARIGMVLDLKNSGHSLEDAARITTDAMHDYGQTSVANRRARDLIPFWQFQAKSIPQNAKFLAEKPWLATGMAAAFHENKDDPIYPYMQGKLNIPLGKGNDGNMQYATGLGLPFESLGSIPNPSASIQDFGREVEQNVVGNATPILKAGLSATFGTDPYFETPYGSYNRVPVFGDLGQAGGLYNDLAGTGLLEAVDSPLRSVDKLLNDRESPGVRALDMFTGVKIASVDEDRAAQQQLEENLRHNPQVHQFRTFYQDQGNADPATEDVIQQYHATRARIKAKRALSFP